MLAEVFYFGGEVGGGKGGRPKIIGLIITLWVMHRSALYKLVLHKNQLCLDNFTEVVTLLK